MGQTRICLLAEASGAIRVMSFNQNDLNTWSDDAGFFGKKDMFEVLFIRKAEMPKDKRIKKNI